jgi:hypothetical protein
MVQRSSDNSALAGLLYGRPEFQSWLGTPGGPSTERGAMRKQEWTIDVWMYECIVRKNIENKQKEWLMPPNL